MRKAVTAIASMMVIAGLAMADEGSDTKKKVASSAEKTKPLKTGDTIPDVTLHTADGEAFNLREEVAKQPAALVFYRGGWCPYCTKHMSELSKLQGDIEKAGYQILAISPDSPAKLAEAGEKKDFGYTLLSDSKMKAALGFGLAFKLDDETLKKYKGYGIDLKASSGGGNADTLPVPAFYLVGTDGKITFDYTNPDYTVRISKDDVLAALK